jgi:hypothetical protein
LSRSTRSTSSTEALLGRIKQTFHLELIDLDGNPVTGPNEEPIQIGGEFEVGRPPGVRIGAMLTPRRLGHRQGLLA